jgi:hypothetical protein
MFCQSAYIFLCESDRLYPRTIKFHQHCIASGRIVANTDVSGPVVIDEECPPQKNTLGIEQRTDGLDPDVEGREFRLARHLSAGCSQRMLTLSDWNCNVEWLLCRRLHLFYTAETNTAKCRDLSSGHVTITGGTWGLGLNPEREKYTRNFLYMLSCMYGCLLSCMSWLYCCVEL